MFSQLNLVPILVASVIGFGAGGLWYGPICGKAWQAARGLTDDDMKSANMPMIFGLTFLLNLVSATVLSHVLATYGSPDLHLSVMVAGGVALGFILPAMGVNYLFSRQSLKLYLIDAGYWLLIYVLMGIVFSLLR